MAMEAISDVTRRQPCFCCLCSCLSACCLNDFANITLYGKDATSDMLLLKNVARSTEVAKHLASHIQELQAKFRETVNLGKRINEIKYK